MNNDQLYFYNRGFNDCLAKGLNPAKTLTDIGYETVFDGENYTTKLKEPAKTLTDEEIKEVIRKHWNRELGNRGMLALCKAILKKASEK